MGLRLTSFHHGPTSNNSILRSRSGQKQTISVESTPEFASSFVHILRDLHHIGVGFILSMAAVHYNIDLSTTNHNIEFSIGL